jgi:hypothetical protein
VSTADQLLSAKISAVCRRHCARGRIEDQDQAVAELRAFARPDLLAEHAGVSLGWADAGTETQAPGFRAEAELCRAAGAPADIIEQWIEAGRARCRAANATPYTGGANL